MAHIEVDQSGRIGDTSVATVLAFSNEISFSILILAAVKIICTASISGMVAWGYGDVHYCAAKAGIMGLAKRLTKDLAPYNINVNAVAPGSV